MCIERVNIPGLHYITIDLFTVDQWKNDDNKLIFFDYQGLIW